MTTTEVCKLLNWSQAKLNYIEKGKWVEPNSDAVADLCEVYGVEGEEQEALIKLARDGRQRGWWTRYNDVFHNEFPGFETAASSVLTFQNTFVPGLLQCAEYITEATRFGGIDDPAEIERHVTARLERKELLLRLDSPARFHAVMDENVVLRLNSSPVQRPQLQHMITMLEHDNVALQIIPTSVGLYQGAGEAFTYLGFSDPAERDIVFLETRLDDRFLEEKDELKRYRSRFDELCTAATSVEATRAYLLHEFEGAK